MNCDILKNEYVWRIGKTRVQKGVWFWLWSHGLVSGSRMSKILTFLKKTDSFRSWNFYWNSFFRRNWFSLFCLKPLTYKCITSMFFAYNQSCLLNFFQFICPWYWTVNRTSLLMEKSGVESKKLASFNITTTESHSFRCKYF